MRRTNVAAPGEYVSSSSVVALFLGSMLPMTPAKRHGQVAASLAGGAVNSFNSSAALEIQERAKLLTYHI